VAIARQVCYMTTGRTSEPEDGKTAQRSSLLRAMALDDNRR
jgi:hypothetical protein